MGFGDPKRVRSAVRYRGHHIGYVTVSAYPDRDVLPFSAGSPYSEIVVSGLDEQHVALLQEFKAHWLIHCGPHFGTTDAGGKLDGKQLMALAAFALLRRTDAAPVLVAALKASLEKVLGRS